MGNFIDHTDLLQNRDATYSHDQQRNAPCQDSNKGREADLLLYTVVV